MSENTLRASVTSQAGGVNLCVNGGFISGTEGYSGPLTWHSYEDVVSITGDSPIGSGGKGMAEVEWQGVSPQVIEVPTYSIVKLSKYTFSAWVYLRQGAPDIRLRAGGEYSTSTVGRYNEWVRLSLTFAADQDTDLVTGYAGLDIVPVSTLDVDEPNSFITGVLIQPGDFLGAYTDGGGQSGANTQILVDGAETPITASGLAGYLPSPGDRLLVQRVGGKMEILQFISRGTVPYITDTSTLESEIEFNTQVINDNGDLIGDVANLHSLTQAQLDAYAASSDSTISGLQSGYDTLNGLGAAGVEEDYIYVGDDPAQSTLKLVQISTYVQAGLSAGNSQAFLDAFGGVSTGDMGDVIMDHTTPPMTQFYQVFVSAGLVPLPWNN